MTRWFCRGLFVTCLMGGLARAEYSPLSSLSEGDGMPLAQMGSRERGMGEAGMAALSTKGYFLPNISRSAYYDRTSFTATLETDMDWLHDNSSANHNLTLALPTLATFIKTPKLGTLGLYYQQSYLRHFGAMGPVSSTDSSQQTFTYEGGQYLLGVSWAYSPIPLFALGVSENVVLEHDRLINSATFDLPDGENISDTALEMSQFGYYPTFSGTLHTRRIDAALSFTPEVHLNTTRRTGVNLIIADSIPDTSRSLPMSISAGAAWRVSNLQTAVFDVYYENWNSHVGLLNPSYKIAMGYEVRGLDNPFVDYHKRLTYRGGMGYDLLYLDKTSEFYGTGGIGFPLGPRGHVLDVSLKYGHRTSGGNTFFAEDYVKISASVVGVSIWGQPARRRH